MAGESRIVRPQFLMAQFSLEGQVPVHFDEPADQSKDNPGYSIGVHRSGFESVFRIASGILEQHVAMQLAEARILHNEFWIRACGIADDVYLITPFSEAYFRVYDGWWCGGEPPIHTPLQNIPPE